MPTNIVEDSIPGPLQLVHWQSDVLTTRLDLIRWIFFLIDWIRPFMVGSRAGSGCRKKLKKSWTRICIRIRNKLLLIKHTRKDFYIVLIYLKTDISQQKLRKKVWYCRIAVNQVIKEVFLLDLFLRRYRTGICTYIFLCTVRKVRLRMRSSLVADEI